MSPNLTKDQSEQIELARTLIQPLRSNHTIRWLQDVEATAQVLLCLRKSGMTQSAFAGAINAHPSTLGRLAQGHNHRGEVWEELQEELEELGIGDPSWRKARGEAGGQEGQETPIPKEDSPVLAPAPSPLAEELGHKIVLGLTHPVRKKDQVRRMSGLSIKEFEIGWKWVTDHRLIFRGDSDSYMTERLSAQIQAKPSEVVRSLPPKVSSGSPPRRSRRLPGSGSREKLERISLFLDKETPKNKDTMVAYLEERLPKDSLGFALLKKMAARYDSVLRSRMTALDWDLAKIYMDARIHACRHRRVRVNWGSSDYRVYIRRLAELGSATGLPPEKVLLLPFDNRFPSTLEEQVRKFWKIRPERPGPAKDPAFRPSKKVLPPPKVEHANPAKADPREIEALKVANEGAKIVVGALSKLLELQCPGKYDPALRLVVSSLLGGEK